MVRDSGVFSSKQREVCHVYFFKNKNFNNQPYVCNECHGASLRAQCLADFKIVTNKKGTLELFAIFHTMKLLVCLKQVN